MLAYEFYWRDPIKGYRHIGTLPERRKGSTRITEKSVINWVEDFFGKSLDIKDIFFIEVRIDKDTGRIFRPNLFLRNQEKM
jgi:hypothetical protein